MTLPFASKAASPRVSKRARAARFPHLRQRYGAPHGLAPATPFDG